MKDDTKDNDYDSKKVAAGNNSGHGGSALMDLEDKVLLATYQRIMSDPGSASGGSSEDKQQKEAQRETQIQAPVRDMQESLRVSSPVDLSVARFSPDDKDNQEGLARAQLEPAVRDGSVKLCHSSSTSVCLQNDEAKQMIDRFYANMGDIDSKGLSRYSGVNPTPVSQFKKSVADHDMKGEKTGTDEQIIRHLDAIMDDIEAKDLAQGTTSPTTSQVKNMVAEEQIARRLDATMGDVEAKRVTRYRGMDPSQTTLLSFLDPVSDEAKQKLDNNIAGNGDEVECNSRHSGKHVMSSSSSFGTGSQAGATVESITTAVSEEHNSHAVLTHGSNLPTQQDEENSFVPGASIQIVLGPGAHAVMTPLPADSGGSTVTVTNEQDADIEQDVDIEQLSNQSDTDNNKGLAIANFVVEEDRDIPLAEAVTGRLQVSTSTKTRYYLIVASICCFVFGGLAVLLLVVFFLSSASQDEKDATINGAPTVPSQNASKISPLAKEEYVLSLLPSHTSDQIKKRPEGPQALALKWLLQNDTVLLGDMEDGVLRSPWRYLQRFSLMTFYYSTEGPRWFNSTGWGTSADECNWHQFDIYQSIEYGDLLFENPDDIALLQLWNISGWDIDHDDFLHSHENQSACNANGEYQHLSLYSNNLRGSIPEELYMLTSLKSLYLFANELHGTISARIGDLRKLEAVRLTGNAVAGSLPTEIGLLSSTFQRASLNSLQLTGTIPTEIGLLRNLQNLYLEINHLTGELPTTLGLMENLKLFYVFSNELTGFLPTELGKLAKMKDFQMYVNSMSGTIPTEIGSMANLIRLYIDELGLSGTIPTEIGKLTLMKDIWLGNNALTGNLPSELSLMAPCYQMNLGPNQLLSTIPSELGSLPHIELLHMEGMSLFGSIPVELASIQSMVRLRLNNNQLTGKLPSEVGRMTGLSSLLLHNNFLSSAIPSELGMLTAIAYLNTANNSFSGELPAGMQHWQNVAELDFSNNMFDGPLVLPFLSKSLEYLNVSGNIGLTGTIPLELCVAHTVDLSFDCSEELCGCNCSCNSSVPEKEEFLGSSNTSSANQSEISF